MTAFYADLHVHSKFSRATSRDCDLEHLALWARRKGVGLVGTGDFTHPAWQQELRDKLREAEPGLLRLRPDLEAAVEQALPPLASPPGYASAGVRFMLQTEISTIYKRGGRTRKVHHLLYLPSLKAAERLSRSLDAIGNISSDGRPILGLDSRALLAMTLEADSRAFLVPAHIWTPWFSVLGSRSGFDAVDECYGDLANEVFALETGLSSDPPMNWRLSALDRYRLISNSDLHSPAKLGREACVFHTDTDFFAVRRALATGEGYGGTVEFFPEEGKYHLDGHRKCGVRLDPGESRKREGLCPACGKPLTLGVLHRVCALADRDGETPPAGAAPFRSFIPLVEILSELRGVGPASKSVRALYDRLLALLGPELHILGDALPERVSELATPALARALERMRAGRVRLDAGFDGEYGRVRLFAEDELEAMPRTGRDFRLD